MAKVLVVDDVDLSREAVAQTLLRAGMDIETAGSPREALAKFKRSSYQAVVTDYRMPGMDGLTFLQKLQQQEAGVPVIVITAYGSVHKAVRCMRAGAHAYLTWPTSPAELTSAVSEALRGGATAKEDATTQDPSQQLEAVREHIKVCPGLRAMYPQIVRIAKANATALITGESGTGKELVASAIHYLSSRAHKPFLRVNCAALPTGLLESEMFGHERGAFTGAERTRLGRFEMADGGTILLDEVAELDLQLQSKLLRVLQEKEFERVGSSLPRRVDVRVIATTNQELPRAVEEERFRRDLYFRLSVVPISIPPLRERPDDIVPLAAHFLTEQAELNGHPPLALTPELIRVLQQHPWPGNARELENLAARLHVMGSRTTINDQEVRQWLGQAPDASASPDGPGSEGDGEIATLAEMERKAIRAVLERFGGHRRRTAEALGISVRTLQNKIKLWQLA